MKAKIISLLLASSMATGNFAVPPAEISFRTAAEEETFGENPEGKKAFREADKEEDILTDGTETIPDSYETVPAIEGGTGSPDYEDSGMTLSGPEGSNDMTIINGESSGGITGMEGGSSDSDTLAADTSAPDTSVPDTSAPDTSTPDSSVPETLAPDILIPESMNPGEESPDAMDPEAENSALEEPEAEGPETGDPEAESPETGNLEAESPETGGPEAESHETRDPESKVTDESDTGAEDDEPEGELEYESGGYEFSGFLEDGIPNYIWVGEGSPSVLGHEYTVMAEAPDPVPSAEASDPMPLAEAPDPAPSAEASDPLPLAEAPDPAPSLKNPDPAPSAEALDSAPEEENQISDQASGGILTASAMPAFRGIRFAPMLAGALQLEGEEDRSSEPERLSSESPRSGGGENYIADTKKREVYQGFKHMSTETDLTMSDGLHTMADGTVRAYKDGKYFVGGGFALDSVVYYADENGSLIGGWLKTIIDSGTPNLYSVKNDMAFAFRYFDRTTYEMQTGYVNADGLWHYFNERGAMLTNNSVMVNGNYYFADRYGICEPVRLRYGNTIISEDNQNNDMYLAKNMVNAVDINTFNGQNGEYSFRPKWNNDRTSLELFGFIPEENSAGFYCPLLDDSLKGRIGCIYRNVGKYMGRDIDMRLTITDYEFFDLGGDIEVGYFYVFKNRIGLNATNTRSITANMEFIDHSTGMPVSLKGYATFSDIDIGQSVTILSPVDEVYVDKNCVLYKDPGSMAFTAPFVARRIGDLVGNSDRENWVQVNYSGSNLSFRFGSAYEQFLFADSGGVIAGEARDVWNKSYSGNPQDYSIGKGDGLLYQSWQGLYYKRLGRISIPPVKKLVSDSDETDVFENRLQEEETGYFYTLVHNVPGESPEYFYDSYTVTDELEEGLSVSREGIYVTDDNGTDVTDRFDVAVTGRVVTFTAKNSLLGEETFYDNNYSYRIPVTISDVNSLPNQEGEDFIIYNHCTAGFTRSSGPETSTSNETTTRIRMEEVFGTITITKKILEEDIVWAHGNPTFLFSAEGTDSKNVSHRYEEFLCFSAGNYSVDGSGYATLSVIIPHVPAGVYRIFEMPVNDYYLTKAEAQTDNMEITMVGEPGRGKLPASVAYGTGTLTREAPDTGITFTDRKGDYHGYRHTDVVKNNIPVAFDTET